MLTLAVSTLSALFFVIDPVGTVPLFLAMTATNTETERRQMARRAVLIAFVALTVFALSGRLLFDLLGISLGAFRIAGGVLLFLLAIDMLRALPSRQRSTPEEEAEGIHKLDVSVFPLAIPMLAGPGSITAVIMLASEAPDLLPRVVVIISLAVILLATLAILYGASGIERRLGHTGMNILHRVMGLLLAALAAQFVVDGALEVFPALGRSG